MRFLYLFNLERMLFLIPPPPTKPLRPKSVRILQHTRLHPRYRHPTYTPPRHPSTEDVLVLVGVVYEEFGCRLVDAEFLDVQADDEGESLDVVLDGAAAVDGHGGPRRPAESVRL